MATKQKHEGCVLAPAEHDGVLPRRSGHVMGTDRARAEAEGWTPPSSAELVQAIIGCRQCSQTVFSDGATSCRDDLLGAISTVSRDHAYPAGLGGWTDREVLVLASILARQDWLEHDGSRPADLLGLWTHFHAETVGTLDRNATWAAVPAHRSKKSPRVNQKVWCEREAFQSVGEPPQLGHSYITFAEVLEVFHVWLLPLVQQNARITRSLAESVIGTVKGRKVPLPGPIVNAIRQNIVKNNLGTATTRLMVTSLGDRETALQLIKGSDNALRRDLLDDFLYKLNAKVNNVAGDPLLQEAYRQLAHETGAMIEKRTDELRGVRLGPALEEFLKLQREAAARTRLGREAAARDGEPGNAASAFRSTDGRLLGHDLVAVLSVAADRLAERNPHVIDDRWILGLVDECRQVGVIAGAGEGGPGVLTQLRHGKPFPAPAKANYDQRLVKRLIAELPRLREALREQDIETVLRKLVADYGSLERGGVILHEWIGRAVAHCREEKRLHGGSEHDVTVEQQRRFVTAPGGPHRERNGGLVTDEVWIGYDEALVKSVADDFCEVLIIANRINSEADGEQR